MLKIDPIENYTGQFGLTMTCLHYSGFSLRVFFLILYIEYGEKGFMKIALMIFQKKNCGKLSISNKVVF